MPLKPRISSQNMSQIGMGRPGGIASRGSTRISSDRGSSLAAMQNMLLKLQKPPAKKLSSGKGRQPQFNTQAGGQVKAGRGKNVYSQQSGSTLKYVDSVRTPVPKAFRNKATMY